MTFVTSGTSGTSGTFGQSMGTFCVLQNLLSLSEPEQFPPFCSILIFLRDLVLVPTPQGFEQDNQVDQGPQTQSSGSIFGGSAKK